jgi:toxin ParE1/3/4
MYKVKLLPTAKIDLADIVDYLSQFYSSTAIKQYERIINKINNLKDFPLMCEEYPVDVMGFRYRRLVVDEYLVFYIVLEDTIEVHRIINSRMDLTKIFP